MGCIHGILPLVSRRVAFTLIFIGHDNIWKSTTNNLRSAFSEAAPIIATPPNYYSGHSRLREALVMRITCATDAVFALSGDNLVAANLDGSNLHRALLEGEDMSCASFVGADLRGAYMSRSNLSQANLNRACLITADVRNANLHKTSLRNCRAIGSHFDESDLSLADFQESDIGFASFLKARLQGAKMLCLRIELASFAGAIYDKHTLWPQDFDPIAAGAFLETEK